MTKVITVAADKGGVGKTTVLIQMAEHFAHDRGKRGLVVDLDPQGNSSSRNVKMHYDPFSTDGGKLPDKHPDYNPNDPDQADWDGISSTADIFRGKDLWPYPSRIPNLQVIPAYASLLQDVEAVTKEQVAKKVYERLVNFIQLDFIKEEFDFVIIDTRPSKGPLTTAAIKAATHLLIPAMMEQYSIDGIFGMLQLWKSENYTRTPDRQLNLIGILPNLVTNVNLHKDFLFQLRQTTGISEYVMPCELKKRTVYAELMVDGASPRLIYELPDSHPAKQESEDVCNCLYERIFNDEKN